MKVRLDRAVHERGIAPSRERAKALIMEGRVLVDDVPVNKAGAMVGEGAAIKLKGDDIPFVGRGGLKLDAAIEGFGMDVTGMAAMDVGASTGGFTDCLLQRGARKVYAIDVGYGQMHEKLRSDQRVVVMDRTNIRNLSPDALPERVDIAVVDVSFISLRLVLPAVRRFLCGPGADIVALVKPQFEVGKGRVGKGGIVRDDALRQEALQGLADFARELGFLVAGTMPSPITGQKGNVEYLIHLKEE